MDSVELQNQTPTYDTPVHIRWWIRRDMPETLAIDEANNAWQAQSEEDLLRDLRQRNVIGMVAEKGEVVVGFMVYELLKSRLHILTLNVHPDWHRQDIGTQMINKLKSKLSSHRRTKISIALRETNLDGQLFLKKMGFKAVKVVKDAYEDTNEDAFLFEYEIS